MSKSSHPDLRAYAAERFPPGQFVPLVLLLLLASLVGGREASAGSLGMQFLLASAWVFQFRLWDDLHDRERDRVTHPDRVLVRARTVRFFGMLAAFLAVLNILATGWLLSWTISLTILLPLNLLLLGWYLLAPRNRSVHAQFVLLKYPVFVLALGGGFAALSAQGLLILLLIFLTFGVYELMHDSALRGRPGGRRTLLLEALLLALTWFLVAGWVGDGHPGVVAVLVLLATGGCLVISWLWRSGAGPERCRGIFVPSLLQLIVLAFLNR